jgi:hypothetical protein
MAVKEVADIHYSVNELTFFPNFVESCDTVSLSGSPTGLEQMLTSPLWLLENLNKSLFLRKLMDIIFKLCI